jgi:hypothetical protein
VTNVLQFQDKVYRIATTDALDAVVVPPKFLPELRQLPDSVLSFSEAIEDVRTLVYIKAQPILTNRSLCMENIPSYQLTRISLRTLSGLI